MSIKLLQRHEIDDERWDQCINNDEAPSVFAKCWYLDIFTNQLWRGLVYGDYQAVMPLYIKKKWLIPYITQPFLCQKGGVFSMGRDNLRHYSMYQEAVKKIASLNILARVAWPEQARSIERVNHILGLDSEYEVIKTGYNRNTKRNIHHAENAGLNIDFEYNPDLITSFLAENDQSGYIKFHVKAIRELVEKSFDSDTGFAIKASLNCQVNSIAFFIKDNDRLYFLLCASDTTGKSNKSMYLLIDNAIKIYAGKVKIFDFTGSLISNIARRNIGFGAKAETYYQLKWNRFRFLVS